MAIGTPVNPGKSFNFVRVVTNVVLRDTNIRQQVQNGAPVPTARQNDTSPQDLANTARKSSFRTQANITPHDRLIDLVV